MQSTENIIQKMLIKRIIETKSWLDRHYELEGTVRIVLLLLRHFNAFQSKASKSDEFRFSIA